MKIYSIENYVRYKHDLAQALKRIGNKQLADYTEDELITRFLPLVENLARKFSTGQQASGVMSIMDLIQEGSYGLTAGVKRIDWDTILESEDQIKTMNLFYLRELKEQ